MKGTKLWQATGSPVIQGMSRHRRSFLNVWVRSVLVSVAAITASLFVIWALPGVDALPVAEAFAAAMLLLLPALPGIVVGSVAGVGLARLIGSRRPWIAGAVAGIPLGVLSLVMLASQLTVRGVTLK